jgi:hypothetical protein
MSEPKSSGQSLPTTEPSFPTTFDFGSLEPIVVGPFVLRGKKYILREATEGAAVTYRNALLKSTKLGPDGKPTGIDGMAFAEPLLVQQCLFEVDATGPGTHGPVSLKFVNDLPSRVATQLFETAKKISRLDDEEKQEVVEKRFVETAKKLVEYGDNDAERALWDDWMSGVVRKALAVDPSGGGEKREDEPKNS